MPIDKTFRDTWRIIDQHEGHPVWMPEDNESRIHGNNAGVDFTLCYGCKKCIIACPTDVFVIFTDEQEGTVVDPLNDSNCILCLVCEIVCPVEAISIKREGGSEDTLNSLLQSSE